MKIQVLSDLHVEFRPDHGIEFLSSLDPTGVDVLVIPGDLALGGQRMLGMALDLLCIRYPHVVFIAGNHEYYQSSQAAVHAELQEASDRNDNLHWLENESVRIDGQRFVGTTLWFPDREDGSNARYQSWLNDFSYIEGFRDWVYEANAAAMYYLSRTVQEGDVVVTHHIPAAQGVHPKWASSADTIGRFFLCQMPDEVLRRPAWWLFGHAHDSMKFKLGNCNFLCNPYGYWRRDQNKNFQVDLTVEISR